MIGFEEAKACAVSVEVRTPDAKVAVSVVTVPALALLKFMAWGDRPDQRGDDVDDIGWVIANYLGIGNIERLRQGEHEDLPREHASDPDAMAARLLGRDIAAFASDRARQALRVLLESESSSRGHRRFAQRLRSQYGGDFRRAQGILHSLLQGLTDNGGGGATEEQR